MMELIKDMGGKLVTGEAGSRKAQAFLLGLAGCFVVPELAWQIAGLTSVYILGRSVHDAALARGG